MTRELNVRITLEEEIESYKYHDSSYAYWIDKALSDVYSIKNVDVQVETVKPENKKK